MNARDVKAIVVDEDPQAYEDKNVHAIYDEIASHFSSTRYKPWPIIATFISSLPTGWIGLDSGAGNGKYLALPSERPGDIFTIGLDRSRKLLEIAKNAGGSKCIRDVVWGDVLGSGWRTGAFDYAISIATIHHLATVERRKAAVKRLLEQIVPTHGRVLIYVWAIEQDELSKRKIPTISGTARSIGQDVVVPWVLNKVDERTTEKQAQPQIFERYYHMFAKGELSGLVQSVCEDMSIRVGPRPDAGDSYIGRGLEIVQDGWERSNYYVELRCWEILK